MTNFQTPIKRPRRKQTTKYALNFEVFVFLFFAAGGKGGGGGGRK
jgi:hypothetical protein